MVFFLVLVPYADVVDERELAEILEVQLRWEVLSECDHALCDFPSRKLFVVQVFDHLSDWVLDFFFGLVLHYPALFLFKLVSFVNVRLNIFYEEVF